MAVESLVSKTVTLDSTRLFLSATNSSQSSLSFPPIPSSFPHSKLIPKTRFLVDAFRLASDFSVSYFLSHFHSDHYFGLTPFWSKGIVFCSPTTARLLIEVLKIPQNFIFQLPVNETVVVDGCEVTLIDANHFPGAVQFLFKIPGSNGSFERYVHTGDCRFSDSMKSDRFLSEFVGCDAIFLDTTYCNPKFVFPSQEESVEYVVNVVGRIGGEYMESKKSVLFLVATYVVGKEKILVEIASRCHRKIHVDGKKMAILHVLGYGNSGIFTEDESETDVHVVGWNVLGETWPYFRPNFVRMKEIMVEKGYDKVVGFVPTGWTYEVKRNKFTVRSKDSFEIHLVPYSEHSNYDELREYVRFLKPRRVNPTVGVDIEKLDSKHAQKLRKHFSGLVDEMANKKEFLLGFRRGLCENGEKVKLSANADLNEELEQRKKQNKSEIIPVIGNSDVIGLGDSSSLQDSGVLTDVERERIIQELHDCLPKWVTRDQILELISSSGRNIIQAVSNFYERETEFYEQVSACKTSVSTSQACSFNDSASLPKSDPFILTSQAGSFKSSPNANKGIYLSQGRGAPSMKFSTKRKSSVSPGKRRKTIQSKSNKKVKSNSKPDSSGSKQSTITRFFTKVLPGTSEGGTTGSKSEECPEDVIMMPSDSTEEYREEIDQFIKIINAGESSRSYAFTVLEKTKGDINMALDIHYSNPKGNCHEKGVEMVVSGDSVRIQNCTDTFSSGHEKDLANNLGHVTNSSLVRHSMENTDTTLLSLPLEKYKPIEDACWRHGEPAPYIHLSRAFDLVEAEKGKIKATSMLCNMFRSLLALSPEDVLPAVYLCTNKIAPDHENIELNIGGSLVTSALEEACGTNRVKVRDLYNKFGDLGDVAQACRQKQTLLAPPPPLLISDVFSMLREVSVQTGSGSTIRKKNIIVNLMRSCREKEMKFVVRTLVRNLRIGAMMRTVLPALAQAVVMDSSPSLSHEGTADNIKEKLQCLSSAVVEAYNILPNLDLVVPLLMRKGITFSSSALSMVPGIPIKPMLAKITNGVPQVLKLFQNKGFTCEYKYDGQRAQIHKLADGTMRVFSRNGEETTSRFPDLVNIIKESCKPAASTFILDAEVVAVDRKNGCKLMSFQELSSRERGGKDSLITVDSIKV
ncbi:hypothetical protein SLEP1_g10767 [Rubroshorea leprosula]|uniref:DNA ligase n=2 Tax=Rubroshorea leprosula TaxID=152421 RepID=A0AAV5IJ42_9ROSI|nr:hypothetical protein SLEP1_g10767 [Rubroshorea leprosula]